MNRFIQSIYFVVFSIFRIQDLDGGFFEKFGSLLRQKSEITEEKITPLAPLPSDSSVPEDEVAAKEQLRTIEEVENDSGTETLQDTDSEHEEHEQTKKEEFVEDFTGWNVSRLLFYITTDLIIILHAQKKN